MLNNPSIIEELTAYYFGCEAVRCSKFFENRSSLFIHYQFSALDFDSRFDDEFFF